MADHVYSNSYPHIFLTIKIKKMKTGIELITEERKKQIEKHGRTAMHDAQNNDFGQLKDAAIMLMDGYPSQDEDNSEPFKWNEAAWSKLTEKPKVERLIIAGALIAAEIDRLYPSAIAPIPFNDNRKFSEYEISQLQTKVHKITGDGEVMMLFNELLGINAG